ncbi:hypothetical protein [Melittangium boletus]|uniref:Lipoprotein n=1 Tax=Melittangium boletus DSM 14713 TaxID=1294270 RepID=A0A250I6I9_9BACT|nr:hypothetical protein [Melittangium boletus]ATB26810.1 hypothetical protein MEBOL_000244 [Melittangium boletus DSM 14713]
MRQPSLIRATLVIAAGLISHAALAQPPGHRGPPPEAIEACASKSQGATCTVTFRDRQVEGTCDALGDTLACRPAHPPGPPPEATAACQGLTEGQACTVTFHDQQHAGTCRTGPDQQLACFPERMPSPPGGPGGRR